MAGQATKQQRPSDKRISLLRLSFSEGNWNMCLQQSSSLESHSLTNEERSEVNFIHAMSALKSEKTFGPAKATAFIAAHKSSVESQLVTVALGDYHFKRKEYSQAINAYSRVSVKQISRVEYARSQYFHGLSAYHMDSSELALEKFKEVTYFRSDYREKSAYYAGYIYYNDKNLYDALRFFLIADESTELQLSGVIGDSYYQLGQRNELIDYANKKLIDTPKSEQVVLHQLLGEVYFEERNYNESSVAFGRVIELTSRKVAPDTYYKLAYSFDQLGQKNEALGSYKIAALDKSDIGQLSSFRSGELYLELENFEFASRSFKQASLSEFDVDITEQAKFLSGKCEMAAENYDEGISSLLDFISEYPSSNWQQEASDLLAEAWLRTSNYERAIEHIEGLKAQTSITKKTYQRVTFLKGQQLFNSGEWAESIFFLDKSLRYTPDRDLLFEARYTSAEASVLLEKKGLKSQYERILNISASTDRSMLIKRQSRYALGYLYFNDQDYERAVTHFDRFIAVGANHPWYEDGRLRLADCYYVLKRYSESESVYNGLLQEGSSGPDYLLYQIGMIHYQQKNRRRSLNSFNRVIDDFPQSNYVERALFQKGQLLFENTQFEDARQTFDRLISTYSSSNLVPTAIMRAGLCSSNLNNYAEALQSFTKIIEVYPNNKVAGEAILGIQDLQKRGFEISNFGDLLAAFKRNNPDNTSLESLDFEQIKTKYFNQQYDVLESITLQFQRDYPTSSFIPDAKYYLADGFYRTGNFEKAAENFDFLADRPDFDFYQRVLDKRGKILLKLGDTLNALDNYRKLRTASLNSKQLFLANEGLMTAFTGVDRDSAYYYAQQIIDSSWKPLNALRNAQLVQLRILLMNGENDEVMVLANELLEGGKDEVGAEASYMLAKTYTSVGEYELSNQQLFQLIQDYGSFRYWTDQAYLLIVKNYVGLGELLQAEASVNSILDNSKDSNLLQLARAQVLEIDKMKAALLSTEADSLSAETIVPDTLK